MNNQFTQRVSDIIMYSKEEANRLRNSYIGPEHLLLGLIREGEGKAIEILFNLQINLQDINQMQHNNRHVRHKKSQLMTLLYSTILAQI